MKAALVHEAGAGHTLSFAAAGDLWVFIDGRLVIDLGAGPGDHAAQSQRIELDRLRWLRDGAVARITVFVAERSATGCDLRIDTTAALRHAGSAGPPPVAGVGEGW
jgi:fibro-slime domain-containing protein